MGVKLDLTGQVFNKLTAIKPVGMCKKNRNTIWEFLCECGKKINSEASLVKTGYKKSCGCAVKNINLKHGMSKTNLYNIYNSIKSRCYNSKNNAYSDYGERGIKVCDRWLESFDNFYKDMGERPSKKHSIERIDVNGDYTPENCIWATSEIQSRNHRKQKNNKTGVTGVVKENDVRYKAIWSGLMHKRHSKSFSINKYGEKEAFKLACEYRIKMINYLNLLGAGYSGNHGL